MNFEITDEEKKLILKRRQEQESANTGMSSGSAKTKSHREQEFSPFVDEMKRQEQTGFLSAKTKGRREREFSPFVDEMKRQEQTGFLAD